ncbi:hypothetical protein ALO94_200490 [Pseudomonas syringae pv. spinaceae]|uniref:Uncharacterized protein n=1 Tax=Pseudomonas syringae pv. spinaceae TaxID=264459 RepID=A0A0Q0F6T4_PSESX|nr:hypothetical protein ALO94_200490 [Pseudomonas syringae pv. spinaceae]
MISDYKRKGALLTGFAWQVDVENAVIDLDVAKVLVVFLLALGQLRFAQTNVGRLGAELEAMAIQVIAIGGDQPQFDRFWRGFDQAQLKGLTNWQEVLAVIQRAATQRWRRAAVQQTGCGGGQGQDQ